MFTLILVVLAQLICAVVVVAVCAAIFLFFTAAFNWKIALVILVIWTLISWALSYLKRKYGN